MKKVRSSNIELFRIICMIMILMCHFTIFSGIENSVSFNKVFQLYSYWGGAAGNAGFIAISAWFLEKYVFRIEKVISLYTKAVIYSLAWLLATVFLFNYNVDGKTIWHCLFPSLYGTHEYVHVFLLMSFMSPFLKGVLLKCKEENLRKFIIVFTVIFTLLPVVFLGSISYMNLFVEFFYMYVLVYYLRHYKKELIEDKRKLLKIFCISVAVMTGFSVFCLVGRRWLPFLTEYTSYQAKTGSIFMIAAMLSLFFLFLKIKLPEIKCINKLASTTYGVYLLHTPYACRQRMYIDLFGTDKWGMEYTFILKVILWIIGVFIICAIIDMCYDIVEGVVKKALKGVLSSKRKIINDFMNDI